MKFSQKEDNLSLIFRPFYSLLNNINEGDGGSHYMAVLLVETPQQSIAFWEGTFIAHQKIIMLFMVTRGFFLTRS